ncbi:DUF2851 family protein [Winogradskyella sp.]|uniref:DUF2851 family protein n=1 Tax=Winogradskyella sp. TaxID=1883156 RepID=UPI003F6AAD6A
MQEDFLHYVWKHKAFSTVSLKTTEGEAITVKNLGLHNHNSGPDFFNAQLIIDDQLWAGNLEIHLKSSDWYLHNHETDKAYDNVILHVVWEHDSEIFRSDNSKIPTLELKGYTDIDLLKNYKSLLASKSWINCEADFPAIDDFILNSWLERIFIERLERKSKDIEQLLKSSQNNWEEVMFKMLLKNFGLKANGESFLSIANSLDFSVVRKLQNNTIEMEALLFGQAGLLNENKEDTYFKELKEYFSFLKQKFRLNNQGVIPIQFFRLRPPNFPTIRLSQFARLYTVEPNLFSKIITISKLDDLYALFSHGVSEYWMTHYTFEKTSKTSKKLLTKTFIDLLIINTIIPLKFAYAKSLGQSKDEQIFELITEIKIENNSVVNKFLDLKAIEKTALNSQALLELKQNYCDKNKCLQCALGNSLIVKN